MIIQNVIDDVELALTGRGIDTRPNPETIRRLIKAKWMELVGEANIQQGKFELTTDGTRELELPESVRRVTHVIVDNRVAYKTTPEARDFTYAEEQAAS